MKLTQNVQTELDLLIQSITPATQQKFLTQVIASGEKAADNLSLLDEVVIVCNLSQILSVTLTGKLCCKHPNILNQIDDKKLEKIIELVEYGQKNYPSRFCGSVLAPITYASEIQVAGLNYSAISCLPLLEKSLFELVSEQVSIKSIEYFNGVRSFIDEFDLVNNDNWKAFLKKPLANSLEFEDFCMKDLLILLGKGDPTNYSNLNINASTAISRYSYLSTYLWNSDNALFEDTSTLEEEIENIVIPRSKNYVKIEDESEIIEEFDHRSITIDLKSVRDAMRFLVGNNKIKKPAVTII
jgi:hypothetical protein